MELEYYREQGTKQNREVGEVNAHGEVVINTKEFLADGIASIYQDEIRESIRLQEMKIQNVADMMKAAGHSENEINEYKASQNRNLDSEITEKRNKLREDLSVKNCIKSIKRISLLKLKNSLVKQELTPKVMNYLVEQPVYS